MIHPKSGFMDQPQMPPLAIYALGSILKEKGVNVKIVDPTYYGYKLTDPLLLKKLVQDIDVFCLSTTTFQWNVSIEIIEALRKVQPTIPVIVGGIHVSYFGEEIINDYPIDFAVEGEGEETLPELLETLASNRNPREVDGILMRDDDGRVIRTNIRPLLTVEELEQTPFPDFTQLPDKLYNVLPFETSRGCLNNCAFCSIAHRGHWRGMSSEIVLNKLGEVLSEHQLKFLTPVVYFVDDCFTVDSQRAASILSGIRDRNLKCSLMLEARIDQLLQDGIIECLSDSQISMLQIGVECGYEEGLKKIGKGVSIEQVIMCVEKLKKYNLNHKAVMSFIIGLPWEGFNEICNTVHFTADLIRKYGVHINTSWWVPMPSRLWRTRLNYGITLDNQIFNDPLWFASPQLFSRLRPLVSKNEQEIVFQMMHVYHDLGCPLVASELE